MTSFILARATVLLLGGSSALALAAIGGCQRSSAAPAYASGPLVVKEATPELAALERAMHERLNRDRAQQGLPPLAFEPRLADVARGHAEDMRLRRFFAHDSPYTGSLEDRLDRAGLLALTARENLGSGPDVEGTQDALLASPSHHANIMATDVTHVGIGIVQAGSAAAPRLLVTQVFATPVEAQAPNAALAALEQRLAAARRDAGLAPLPRHEQLSRLAERYVSELDDALSAASTRRIGDAVTRELSGSGLAGVTVAGGVFITSSLYEPAGALLSPTARALGFATAAARDARGRPAVKVLFLVGH